MIPALLTAFLLMTVIAAAQVQAQSTPGSPQSFVPTIQQPILPTTPPKEPPKKGVLEEEGMPRRGGPFLPEEEEEEVLSSFEEYIQGETSLILSTDLRQFGYELFKETSETFLPSDTVPVTSDFVLGPGDEVRVSLWGKISGEFLVPVDRDGNINLPQIGIIHLAGLTFSEAKSVLQKELSRHYRSSEVQMNVSMGSLKSIRVYVVGRVKKPGAYTLSSLSTATHALFASGGPSKIGTMRDIQVKRNGETIAHLDLYDFLIRGDKTSDIRLMSEDVLFVPAVGPLVGIAGHVKNPAIFETEAGTRLSGLLELAGGLTPLAYKGRIQVQRIENNANRTIFEGNLLDMESDTDQDFPVLNGDLVKIFSILQTTDWKQYRAVQIIGEVRLPGEYIVEKGETLSELIERAGGFTDKAYLTGAVFTRRSVKDLQQTQLQESINRLEQQLLSQSATMIETAISAQSAEQQRLAMEQRRSLIVKLRAAEAKGRIAIDIRPLQKLRGSSSDIILEDGDTLSVPERPQQVQVIGSVYNQTAFIHDGDASVSNYLKKAGGLTKDADEDEIYVLKVNGTAISKRESSGLFSGGLMSSRLDPGDTIVVPEKIERIAWLREFKDITQILYQIAVAAGVLIVVF
jgi:polysaccharide biosynthesis/export protein